MDSTPYEQEQVQQIEDGINELHLTTPEASPNQSALLRKMIAKLLADAQNLHKTLEELDRRMIAPQRRQVAGPKKVREEISMSKDLLKPEVQPLISGMSQFTMTTLKQAIKNRFEGKYLSTLLTAPEQLGITPEEYSIHLKVMRSDNEQLRSYAINEKDIPILLRRVFNEPGTYTVQTQSGKTVELDVSKFIGKTRQEIVELLEANQWCHRQCEANYINLSPYIWDILSQVPVLHQFGLKKGNEVSQESFLKILDVIRDRHEIYYNYVPTHESKILLNQLGIPLVDNHFKLDIVMNAAKSNSIIRSPKEVEGLKRILMGIAEDNNNLLE